MLTFFEVTDTCTLRCNIIVLSVLIQLNDFVLQIPPVCVCVCELSTRYTLHQARILLPS